MIYVNGYPRSGNNFLASSLYYNFFGDIDPENWEEKYRRKIFIDHVMPEELEIFLQKEIKENQLLEIQKNIKKDLSNIIYIKRNYKDVAISNWKSISKTGFFYEYAMNELNFKAWIDHIQAWEKTNAYIIKYEDLVKNFETEIIKIQKKFKLKLRNKKIYRPGPIGLDPHINVINRNGSVADIWWDNKYYNNFYDIMCKKYNVKE